LTNPVQRFDVRFNQSPNGPMLLVRAMEAFELNEVGLAVWRLCDGEHSEAEIAKAIAADFAVAPEEAAADVTEFVSALRRSRLLD
jgi:Coenzyme PQQ synthesis protein D (PqqD)